MRVHRKKRRDAKTGRLASTKPDTKAGAKAKAKVVAEAVESTVDEKAASEGKDVVKAAATPRSGRKQSQRSSATRELEPTEKSTGVSKQTVEGTSVGQGVLETQRAGGQTWTASWKPRKKRKIRSRQKNLRRDTRAKDKLPSYLTEETLRGPRVRRPHNVVNEASADNVTLE